MHFSRINEKRKVIKGDSFNGDVELPPLSVEELPFLKTRFFEVSVFITLIGLTLGVKVFYLQTIKQEAFNERYNKIHYKKEWIVAPRGLIKDRTGSILAFNGPGKRQGELGRLYPQGVAFSHLLGFIGRVERYHLSRDERYLPFDFVGKSGIEGFYETFLRGEHGSMEKQITAGGEITQGPFQTPAKPGNTLTLTVDGEVQKKLYEVLEIQREKFKSPGAAGIVLDPTNGALLALVSLPSFDNNAFNPSLLDDPSKPLFNRAIGGEYPPGSTIKPFLALGALKEHVIDPKKIIYDQGKIEVRSVYNPDIVWTFRGWKALGEVDMRRAIAMSSNIYFYTIGGGYGEMKGLGIEKINQYLRLFGWGRKTGIDLEGERQGLLPLPEWKKEMLKEEWFIGDTYNSSIGQGFLRITPLQLALASAAVANGGTVYKPYLVERIIDQGEREIFRHLPEMIRKDFIDPEHVAVIKEGMLQAVDSGTVWRLKDLRVKVGAKTGTAQVGLGKPYHGWVTLFAPYENPKIVLTILVENGVGGEQSAVPAAKEFLEWYFNKFNVQN